MRLRSLIPLICLTVVSVAPAADSWKLPVETAQYKPGPGMELVVANCSLCHSADYVTTQPPLARPAWKATVEKMRLKYGAPIGTNNVEAILDYLSRTYGQQNIQQASEAPQK